jgi:acyl-CoA synthetase (NDP forming)
MVAVSGIGNALARLDENKYRNTRICNEGYCYPARIQIMGCKTRTDVKTIEAAKDDVSRVFDKVRTQRRKYVHEIEATEVLKSYRFQIIKSRFATTEDECAKLSEEIGYRVVLKVSSPNIVHKTHVGALHMIESTTASRLLGGVRGKKPSDIRSAAECLQRMSKLRNTRD